MKNAVHTGGVTHSSRGARAGRPFTVLTVVEILLYLLTLTGGFFMLLPALPAPGSWAGFQRFLYDNYIVVGVLFGILALALLIETAVTAKKGAGQIPQETPDDSQDRLKREQVQEEQRGEQGGAV